MSNIRKRATTLISMFTLIMLLTSTGGNSNAAPTQSPAAQPTAATTTTLDKQFADPAFTSTWQRTDQYVANGSVSRSWYWGPTPNYWTYETYLDAKGATKTRKVEYFDKSRMEINDPTADPKSAYFVTNGLLTEELISGRMQIGDTTFESRFPSDIPLASDADDGNAPTYRTWQSVSSITGGSGLPAPNQTGQNATSTIDKAGNIGNDTSKASITGTQFVYFEPTTQHNIPAVFWNFLIAQGPVLVNGQRLNQQLNNPWNYATGLPISEPYWASVKYAGHPNTAVLIQAFERRVLTYVPSEPNAAFRVQMGNIGQHYLQWRYQGVGHYSAPLQGPHVGYGFNAALYYVDHNQAYDMVTGAGFGWVKLQISWHDIEGNKGQYAWGQLDQIVADANAKGVKLIFSIAKSPDWATAGAIKGGLPDDPTDLGNFVYQMASHYKGLVSAYEIWNEENYAVETGGHVDPARYVTALRYGYWGVKFADHHAFVLFGALTPTGVNDPSLAVDDVAYLTQIYAINNGEVKDYFDALGAHGAGYGNSPDQLWPDQPGTGACPLKYQPRNDCWLNDPSFYFRRIEQLRQVMETNGDQAKQMWLTEFGWPSCIGNPNPAPGYEYCQLIDEQTQGTYLVRAFQKSINDYPWMGVMAVWNLNFSTLGLPASDEKVPWAVLNSDYSPRPAYTALQQMSK